MKNILLKFGVLFFLGGVLLFSSCGSDDPDIDDGDGTVNVSDGMYFSLKDGSPTSGTKLVSETVDDDNFTSQERSGFVGGYIYLAAGDYNLVQVVSKEVTQTLGGTATAVTDEGSGCDYNTYTLVNAVVDGAAFNVAESGLHRVTYDQITGEIIILPIHFAEILGDATEGGWSTGQQLDGSVTSTGGSWSKEGVVIRAGQLKIRFDCRWNLDRRVDPNLGNDPSNGYNLFTNFGGAVDNLTPGNDQPNISWDESGTYTVTLNWTPKDGFTLDLNRTGDAPTITFDPNEYRFGVIGDATAGGWDSDQNLFHKVNEGVHTWYGVVTFAATGEYKFRTNDSWDFNLGGDLGNLSKGGGNIPSPGEGEWDITISTADEGETWSATVMDTGWGIIGTGSPTGSWDFDMNMTSEGFNGGISTYTLTGAFTTDSWKFRAGDDWALNLGGNVGALTIDGGDLTMSEAGNYKVTLLFNGEDFSAVVEKQ